MIHDYNQNGQICCDLCGDKYPENESYDEDKRVICSACQSRIDAGTLEAPRLHYTEDDIMILAGIEHGTPLWIANATANTIESLPAKEVTCDVNDTVTLAYDDGRNEHIINVVIR